MTLQLTKACFDKLSTNGKNPTNLMPAPFALSLSKPVLSLLKGVNEG